MAHHNVLLRRLLGVGLVVVAGVATAVVTASGAAESAPNDMGPQGPRAAAVAGEQVFDLTWDSQYESHIYSVRLRGGDRFTVDTSDCCIPGDHWGAVVTLPTGKSTVGAADVAKTACAFGRVGVFEGPVTLTGAKVSNITAQVVVLHCSGVNVYPAGLSVRFRYNGSMVVTRQT